MATLVDCFLGMDVVESSCKFLDVLSSSGLFMAAHAGPKSFPAEHVAAFSGTFTTEIKPGP